MALLSVDNVFPNKDEFFKSLNRFKYLLSEMNKVQKELNEYGFNLNVSVNQKDRLQSN